MTRWDLFVFSPSWVEESGLPEEISRKGGPEAWTLFRKLLEIDSERSLIPDWFSVNFDDLSRWTGVPREKILTILNLLGKMGKIVTQAMEESSRIRISVPLEVPEDIETIRRRLRRRGIAAENLKLRYMDESDPEKRYGEVLTLYQSVYGARMNGQIADDLRTIAETFEWPAVEEAFRTAGEHKNWTLTGIINHLYKELQHGSAEAHFGDTDDTSLPSGYEFT
jgi:hypothetical protein